MEYASNGKGNLGVTLGAIGAGGWALNGGLSNLLGGGLFGNNNTANLMNNFVNKETYDVQLDLIDSKSENALLKADLASEKKMVEVFNAANDKIMNVREELNNRIYNIEKQVDANAAAQAVINCGFTSANAVLNTQVGLLMGLTKTGIPNSSLCPGYGNVTITPTTTTTTTT